MLSKPNKWRAEWSNSPALQEKFPSAESYAEHRAKLDRESEAPAAAAPMSEAERLAGIDAAALPGHEALIAQLKADASVTPGQAAMRIAAAEKARRTPPKPTAAVLPFRRFASTAAMATEMTAWRTEWSGNVALQQEFADADAYAHFKWAVATGRTRIVGRGPNDAA